jgi:hypothetical protein
MQQIDTRVLRAYLLTRRQALLMELGQIEDLLGLERTKVPKHKEQEARVKRKKNASG